MIKKILTMAVGGGMILSQFASTPVFAESIKWGDEQWGNTWYLTDAITKLNKLKDAAVEDTQLSGLIGAAIGILEEAKKQDAAEGKRASAAKDKKAEEAAAYREAKKIISAARVLLDAAGAAMDDIGHPNPAIAEALRSVLRGLMDKFVRYTDSYWWMWWVANWIQTQLWANELNALADSWDAQAVKEADAAKTAWMREAAKNLRIAAAALGAAANAADETLGHKTWEDIKDKGGKNFKEKENDLLKAAMAAIKAVQNALKKIGLSDVSASRISGEINTKSMTGEKKFASTKDRRPAVCSAHYISDYKTASILKLSPANSKKLSG